MPDAPEKGKPEFFTTDNLRAMDALKRAHFIAFAPYVFQASIILRDKGILKQLQDAGQHGLLIQDIASATGMSNYAARVILEAGLGIGLVYHKERRFCLAKTGHFFLNDDTTRINTDFMRDVCAPGALDMEQSLMEGRPVGLKHLGPWDFIAEGLSIMPQPAHDSWFAFDHYYSDHAFNDALPLVFAHKPRRILDLGGNTGRFALACIEYDPLVHIGLADLPVQIDAVEAEVHDAVAAGRISTYSIDVLNEDVALPEGYDTIWMSQFLDNFSEDQMVRIMDHCNAALPPGGHMFINQAFWDRQQFEVSAFSLQMTSLYFTTMANGNSQMYNSEVFLEIVTAAGFKAIKQTDGIGLGHTVMELRKI
jgi:hypothetical protein